MSTGKVVICGVDTSTLPVLKNERMRELFPKVHAGDVSARNEFIQGNLRLVLSVLRRFHNRGEHMDDLFQVGCIGLMKAIDHFDVTLGVRFSTYAVPTAVACRNPAFAADARVQVPKKWSAKPQDAPMTKRFLSSGERGGLTKNHTNGIMYCRQAALSCAKAQKSCLFDSPNEPALRRKWRYSPSRTHTARSGESHT